MNSSCVAAREAAIWELEEKQLQEKHQLASRQLKDLFFLKRHQMLTRHDKEMEQLKRVSDRRDEELQRKQALEKRRLPKIQKSDMKTRVQLFKQSLRIGGNIGVEEEREKIKEVSVAATSGLLRLRMHPLLTCSMFQFEDGERKRMKAEQLRQDLKHRKQQDGLRERNQAAAKELEQLQTEKRRMLMEHETQKMKELEDQYKGELHEWKSQLRPRKQVRDSVFPFYFVVFHIRTNMFQKKIVVSKIYLDELKTISVIIFSCSLIDTSKLFF